MAHQPLRPSPVIARLLAAVFDYSALMALVLVIQLSWSSSATGERVPTTGSNWLAVGVMVGYLIVPHALWGATLGKRACRLVVVREDNSPIGWLAAIVRFVVAYGAFGLLAPLVAGREQDTLWWVLSIAQVAVPLGVYVPIMLRADRRGLHDLAARTVVSSTVPPLSEVVETQVRPRSS